MSNNKKRNKSNKPNKQNKTIKAKVSDHFFLRDFTCKCGSCKNTVKVSLGLIGGLELLWSKVRRRINIAKGFSCAECAGSSRIRKNYHAFGIACDLYIPGIPLEKVFKLADEVPEFTGIGLNFTDRYVHVDTRKDKERTLWVVQAGNHIDLTEENRKEYFENISKEPEQVS